MTLEEFKGLFAEAALGSSEEEIKLIQEEISDDVQEAKTLLELDLSKVEPLNIITDNTIELREDVVIEGMDREEALYYANDREYGYIKIKRVIE